MKASELSLKEQYQALVDAIKKKDKKQTNVSIARQLGYTREHFQALLGKAGKVTTQHLLDLRLRFPNVEENITEANDAGLNNMNDFLNMDPSQPIVQVVLNLTYIGRKNAESIDKMATGVDKLSDCANKIAATNQRNTEIIAALFSSMLPNSKFAEVLSASLSDLHKDGFPFEAFVQGEVGTGTVKDQQTDGKEQSVDK